MNKINMGKMGLLAILIGLIFLSSGLVVYAGASKLYLVEIALNSDDSLSLEKFSLSSGYIGRDFLDGPYVLSMVNSEGKAIYTDRFDFPLGAPPKEWFDKKGKQIYFPKKLAKPAAGVYAVTRIVLSVPYVKEGREIRVYDGKGGLAFNIDLSKYCGVSGCAGDVAKKPAGKSAAKPVAKRPGLFGRIFNF